MAAERRKRAAILTSESDRDAAINTARGAAEAQVLNSASSGLKLLLVAVMYSQGMGHDRSFPIQRCFSTACSCGNS